MIKDFNYTIKYTKTEEIAVKECNKIEKIRSRLFCLGLIGAYSNGSSFGSISYRYNKNKNSFVITGKDTGEFPKLSANYYSFVKKVDYQKGKMFCLGVNKPSNEWLIHSYVYKLDMNIKAVIVINNERVWDYMFNNEALRVGFENLDNSEVLDKLYENVDPFLNNSFFIEGHDFSIVAFGKTLSEAEKSLYNIVKKVLNL
ncbi:hypothetical protein [Halarcobacter anaerophilus]|jgi:hypothetical protein|uniref:Class II aldolase/adducin N-terminal domain-containing protein n=1 Tax=Halarcobacter anaerophilus TaxID=877500 RepID=A0A4Q0Y3D4_9BACT|nr:hypothetical protein [Halarcobacter anaerophilus]QDF29421.1 class II aldolase/adducin family protein [Halarcobacter anaerophilus]RXJ64666.1 hypothetical protein CRV06_01525 [Halarcobacter anaerophilus]